MDIRIIIILLLIGCKVKDQPIPEPIKPSITIDSSTTFNIIGRWANPTVVSYTPYKKYWSFEFYEDGTGKYNDEWKILSYSLKQNGILSYKTDLGWSIKWIEIISPKHIKVRSSETSTYKMDYYK
jgi:hypothetical protein